MGYGFLFHDGTLDIIKEGETVFGGLGVRAYPDIPDMEYELKLTSNNENEAEFENRENGVRASLRIEQKGDVFALRISAEYFPEDLGESKTGLHFSPDCALSVDISKIDKSKTFAANYLKCEFWCRTFITDDPAKLPDRIQGLLCSLNGGGLAYAAAVCDKIFRSDIRGNSDGGISLYIRSNDLRNHVDDTVVMVYSQSGDNECSGSGGKGGAKALIANVTERALRIMGKKGRLRTERRYPEILEYLGWCSWDAFHMDVTHDDLLRKAEEFRNKEIPVRWFILDDMWGDVPAITRKTMHNRALNSFEADPVRFPKGLKACITELRDKYGILSGIWHPTTGYWNGILPDGEIAREHKELLVLTQNRKLVHSPELIPAFRYYQLQHSFYRDCGAEFVKVDNQGFINVHYRYLSSFGEAAHNLHTAIEASVGVNFDGAMINCMCMPSENFWNRPVSSVCRFSGDFQPEDRKWFVQHLLQCAYNSLFQGCVYYGDWDMWWSDDAQASKNAVLRAMSGGPVYVSDELDRSVKNTIMPIIYSDGRIIRLAEPPAPSPDCLMADAEISGKIFKLVNRAGDYGILAAFNLDKNENPVNGTVSPSDCGLEGEYVCYDWFARKIIPDTSALCLKNYDDFRLYIFLPVNNGRSFIGLTDKYMSPATLENIGNGNYRLREKGRLGIYSQNGLSHINADGVRIPVVKNGEALFEAEIRNSGAIISF